MVYQRCEDRFIVSYDKIQDLSNDSMNNTATVTLWADGTIRVEYGEVLSDDLLVGVFDGTHTNDLTPSLLDEYAFYDQLGSGIILFDWEETGVAHVGELSNRTIVYSMD